MELNREQIIKALECCASGNSVSACMSGCPIYEKEDCDCINDDNALLKYALNIIKELTVELEAMQGTANSYKRLSVDLAKQVGSLKDELAKRPEPLIITKLPKKKK